MLVKEKQLKNVVLLVQCFEESTKIVKSETRIPVNNGQVFDALTVFLKLKLRRCDPRLKEQLLDELVRQVKQ